MIVLNVTYNCTPEQRDAFLKKLNEEGLAAACRAEAGNIKYDYYLYGGKLIFEKIRHMTKDGFHFLVHPMP